MPKKKSSSRELARTPNSNSSERDSGLPGGGAGRRDVVEPIPDDTHVDPYLTEGNPGYEESGDSEIRPIGRPTLKSQAARRSASKK